MIRVFLVLSLLIMVACNKPEQATEQVENEQPTAEQTDGDKLFRPDLKDLGQLRQRKIADAEKAISEALASGDSERISNAYGRLAMFYHSFLLYQAGNHYYEKAIEHGPTVFQWPYLNGLCLDSLTRFEDGYASMQEAHRLNPKYVPTLIAL